MSQKVPYVSVVVPTFNSGRTLGKCLESILRLDYPSERYEVLVVDGGSTDDTLRLAAQFSVRMFVERKRIRGATYGRGLREAKGEYIAYVDGDGLVSPRWLAEGVSVLAQDSSVAAVYFKSDVPKDATRFQRIVGLYQKKGELLLRKASALQGSGANGVIYRRKVLDALAAFDDDIDYGQEIELTERILRAKYKIADGGPGFVYHYPRFELAGFFIQAVQAGNGLAKLYLVFPERRMLAYSLVRSLIAVLPLLALFAILAMRSFFLSVTISVGFIVAALSYLIYLYFAVGRGYLEPRFLWIALPLGYLSCVGSLVGYVIGAFDHFRAVFRKRPGLQVSDSVA